MNALLRDAKAEDASAIAQVLLASRKKFLPYVPLRHSEAEIAQWMREVLIPSGGVTVACFGAQVVGFLAIAQEDGVSWVNQLYLLPGHVGAGIGSRLLARALRELAPPVRLYTFQANVRARSLYERNGFVPVKFSDGESNEERCPDVLYELRA